MPVYEYRCDQGHTFEVTQRMSDDPLVICETCEAPVQRVFHPVAVHFKGSGFYNTDYGTRKRAREKSESGESGSRSESGGSGSGSESKSKSDSKSSGETKTDSKPSATGSSASD
jgi:putative FmdB family regulatory protein